MQAQRTTIFLLAKSNMRHLMVGLVYIAEYFW